jgi:hypothetical protein
MYIYLFFPKKINQNCRKFRGSNFFNIHVIRFCFLLSRVCFLWPLLFSPPKAALKQAEADAGGPPVNAGFENFRVMFHTATRDHKLPDLIWNQQVRLGQERESRGLLRKLSA